MNIQTNQETIEAIKLIVNQQEDQADNIRVYIAGMGCSGPSFGLTLDEIADADLVDESHDVKFIMAKEIHDQVGDIIVELTDGGYLVKPVNEVASACGSCSGSCG